MAAWRTNWQQIQSQLKHLPRWQFLTVMLVLVLVASCLWLGPPAPQAQWTPLFEHTTLQTDDLRRMEIALAQSGLDAYRIEGQNLLVPSSERPRYIQAISEHDALPVALRDLFETQPKTNLFATREQEQAQQQFLRKQRIRDMLAAFPFVEQVRVQLDQAPPVSLYQPGSITCVVSVFAKNGLVLTTTQANTIRETVAGMVADIRREQIVVIDLSVGAAIDETTATNIKNVNHRTIDQIRIEQQWQQQLVEALRHYPALQVEVRVPLSWPAEHSHDSPPPPIQPQPGPMLPDTTYPAPTLQLGSNGQTSIKQLLNQPTEIAAPDADRSAPQQLEKPAMAQEQTTDTQPVSIAIRIPPAAWNDLLRRNLDNAALPHQPTDQHLALNRVKKLIETDINPVLKSIASASNAPPHLDIALISPPLPTNAEQKWPAWMEGLTGKPGGMILALTSGLALVALIVFTATRRSNRATVANQTAATTPELDTTPTTIELRQQIDRLIKNDPDTAARVIQQWIRKAS